MKKYNTTRCIWLMIVLTILFLVIFKSQTCTGSSAQQLSRKEILYAASLAEDLLNVNEININASKMSNDELVSFGRCFNVYNGTLRCGFRWQASEIVKPSQVPAEITKTSKDGEDGLEYERRPIGEANRLCKTFFGRTINTKQILDPDYVNGCLYIKIYDPGDANYTVTPLSVRSVGSNIWLIQCAVSVYSTKYGDINVYVRKSGSGKHATVVIDRLSGNKKLDALKL